MAEIINTSTARVDFSVTLKLTEGEARALQDICGYGPERFVEWFYANLGRHYLKPHEQSMRSLFTTVKTELPKQLYKFDKVRKFIATEL